MWRHSEIDDEVLRSLIKNRLVGIGGNFKLKIYGKLSCTSGRRMKRMHRVFFHSPEEAVQAGFRPCGHCMATEYSDWKKSNNLV